MSSLGCKFGDLFPTDITESKYRGALIIPGSDFEDCGGCICIVLRMSPTTHAGTGLGNLPAHNFNSMIVHLQGDTNSPFDASSPVPWGKLYFLRNCSTSQDGSPIGVPPDRNIPETSWAALTIFSSSGVTNMFSLVMVCNAP